MAKLSRAIGELEKWHRRFNDALWKGKLSAQVVITIQSTGRKRSVLGWHWQSRWQNRRSRLAEINIVAESLKRRAEEILETLLHEMCHQENAERKVVDVSPKAHQYHNEHFKRAAEAAGRGGRPPVREPDLSGPDEDPSGSRPHGARESEVSRTSLTEEAMDAHD